MEIGTFDVLSAIRNKTFFSAFNFYSNSSSVSNRSYLTEWYLNPRNLFAKPYKQEVMLRKSNNFWVWLRMILNHAQDSGYALLLWVRAPGGAYPSSRGPSQGRRNMSFCQISKSRFGLAGLYKVTIV